MEFFIIFLGVALLVFKFLEILEEFLKFGVVDSIPNMVGNWKHFKRIALLSFVKLTHAVE